MVGQIYKRIWQLSATAGNAESYHELSLLTRSLIHDFASQGRLDRNPFEPARHRHLRVPTALVKEELKGVTCLVTGGLGCVGSALISQLLKFDVDRIILLDKKPCARFRNSKRVTSLICDIRDQSLLHSILASLQPELVFHTAAQRDPGFAEKNVEETVTSNVSGTLNVVQACEATRSVRQVIVSSTGKASRYYTDEIYAGTKKICEFIVDTYARQSVKKYALIRCTHIVNNSLMDAELKKEAFSGVQVQIHSPGKFVTAQNALEATQLMLNALVETKRGRSIALLARNLGWPVESLAVALYYIRQSGRDVPVVFTGNPPGYSEKFFRGQVDWTQPEEVNLLTNVYERNTRRVNSGGDIVIVNPCSVSPPLLHRVLQSIQQASGEKAATEALHIGLKELVRCSLQKVRQQDTLDILRWGLDPHFLRLDHHVADDFDTVVGILKASMTVHGYDEPQEDASHSQHRYYAGH